MSKEHHTAPVTHDAEHGTTRSYVIGFVLSLIFTVIPYYLVVNQRLRGNALLATILTFAIIQMFIQVFFFLHLGRGPKPFYNVVFFFATVGIIIVTVGGSIFIMNNLYRNMSPSEVTTRLAQKEGISQVGGALTGACQELKENHKVIISDGKVSPVYTAAKLCDTITFINKDDVIRKLAFGLHDQHVSYGGEDEAIVRKGYSKSITLNQAGSFIFHDHLNPDMAGVFTVEP